jgi:hypothetical protein
MQLPHGNSMGELFFFCHSSPYRSFAVAGFVTQAMPNRLENEGKYISIGDEKLNPELLF